MVLTKDDANVFVGTEDGYMYMYDVKLKRLAHDFGRIHTSTPMLI